jgi:hypothetical protein
LTFKKKKDEYVLQQLYEFDEKLHVNNFFPWFDAIHIRNNIGNCFMIQLVYNLHTCDHAMCLHF